MANNKDTKLDAEKSLNLRLTKQLNRSLEKSSDLSKDYNKNITSLNKNASKLNENINNLNKILSPSKLPKSLDSLNDKVKTFTKSFDARVIPNKLNKLSSNITTLNRLLETDVFNSFKDISGKAKRKKAKENGETSYSGSLTTPGKDFRFAELNSIYKTVGPTALLGSGRESTRPSYSVGEGLNTIYQDDLLALPGPEGKGKGKRAKKSQAVPSIKQMNIKKAIYETAVFNNAIFKGMKGSATGGQERTERIPAKKREDELFQRLLPGIMSVFKGTYKEQQKYLNKSPVDIMYEMLGQGKTEKQATRAAKRQQFLRGRGASADAAFGVAKEQVLSGFSDFGMPSTVEGDVIKAFRGTWRSYKKRKGALLDSGTQAGSGNGISRFIPGLQSKDKSDLIRTDDQLKKKRDDRRDRILLSIARSIKKISPGGSGGGLGGLSGLGGLAMGGLKGLGGLAMGGLKGVGGLLGGLFSTAGAGIVGAAGAGVGIGLTINEIIDKKFPGANKAMDKFFGSVGSFFSSDVEEATKASEATKKSMQQNLVNVVGKESADLFEKASGLREEAKAQRNQIFGMIGGDEEDAIKLENEANAIGRRAAKAGAEFKKSKRKGITVEKDKTKLLEKSITAPTTEKIQRTEVEKSKKETEDKNDFNEFLVTTFIDTLVVKLSEAAAKTESPMPNGFLGINMGG